MSSAENIESPQAMEIPQRQWHNVSRATYELPLPLQVRLESGVLLPVTAGRHERLVESISDALAHLVGNSIEALDSTFFSTSARIRQHACFQHRLCLRVKADPDKKTISLTDLGCGMTRADLINLLGTSKAARLAAPSASDSDDSDSSSESDEGEESDEDIIKEDGSVSSAPDQSLKESVEKSSVDKTKVEEHTIISCKAVDIGGFYAALCSLGTGIRIGTKARHDEYYEFRVGVFDQETEHSAAFKEFSITRPRDEGTELTVEEGFDKFEDVRGESGTCLTIRLNQEAINAGLLDEEKLKSMFLKIVEATQYTVAFSTSAEALDIIAASSKEKEEITRLLAETIDADPLENVADMAIDTGKNSSDEDGAYNSVAERAKFIPLRLSLGERKILRLVEAFMTCCDYTAEVDRPVRSGARRTHEQLKGISSILRGLVVACDYEVGMNLTQNGNFKEYESFFRKMFEIARRHKILNPEKMRTEYGKLIYVLADTVSPSIRSHLGFSCINPIETVYKFLEARDGLGLLSDPHIETATQEILAGRKSRAQIDSEIRSKERAVAMLKRKYSSMHLSQDDIHLCLYSICDNNSFLNSNRVPIDKIIEYLKQSFSPDKVEEGYSLSIISGEDGARLSHNHERQYYFSLQSLTLWRDIIDDMFRLWAMAESDLLSVSVTYSFQDTGQGFQRVQQSPLTYKAMQQILGRVQTKVKHWVGSSVIHMGDHNVPNALSFIDKYTQVPRILGPIVACLENLERLYDEDKGIRSFVDEGFGGVDKLRKDILYDFFRCAFDGSGADNFYDAGSCIDGRLTSAWNWCSQLAEKPFYPIFRLTGFIGFDGEFK